MQVIGLCRFSYPALGGFQVEHDTIEDRIAYLYAPERLEERFRTFECFTLPSLRAQKDDDYTFLIIIGESFPDHYRQRLEALVADLPQVIIQAHPPKQHRSVMKEAINSVRRFDDDYTLQFRLDDDDAIGRPFIARLRETAEQLKPIAQEQPLFAIDFNTGFIAEPTAEGIKAQEVKQQYWTSALAMMAAPSTNLSIMNFGHMKMWKWMPTLTLPDADMLLRGHNQYNDSRQTSKARPVTLTLLDEAGEKRFKLSYNIDADKIRKVYAKKDSQKLRSGA